MKSIDNKYYNKISNKRSFFIMNIFKNHVKSKGNVVINNYSTSYTSSSDTQLSSDNIEKLNNLIDYIKRNLSNELSTDEMNCIVNNLSPIIDAKTNVQQEDAIKNWNNFKSNLSTASLKLLAISADIVTLGAFLKKFIRIIVYWLINILILIILIKPYIIYLRNEFFVVYSVIAQAGSSFLFISPILQHIKKQHPSSTHLLPKCYPFHQLFH